MKKSEQKETTKTPIRELRKLSTKELMARFLSDETSEEDKKAIDGLIYTPERVDETQYYYRILKRLEGRKIELDAIKYFLLGIRYKTNFIRRGIRDRILFACAKETIKGYKAIIEHFGEKLEDEMLKELTEKAEDASILMRDLLLKMKEDEEDGVNNPQGWVKALSENFIKEKVAEYNEAIKNGAEAYKLAKAKIITLEDFIRIYKEEVIVLDSTAKVVEEIKGIGSEFNNRPIWTDKKGGEVEAVDENLNKILSLLREGDIIRKFPTYEEVEVSEVEVYGNKLYL